MSIKVTSTGGTQIGNISTTEASHVSEGDVSNKPGVQAQRVSSRDTFEIGNPAESQVAPPGSKDQKIGSGHRLAQNFEQNVGLSPREDLALNMRLSLADGVVISKPPTRTPGRSFSADGPTVNRLHKTEEFQRLKDEFMDTYNSIQQNGTGVERHMAKSLLERFHQAYQAGDFDKCNSYLEEIQRLAARYVD